MATIILLHNTTNTIPTSSDPRGYQSFTVDLLDDRETQLVRNKVDLLNGTTSEDVLGIRRKIRFAIRPADVVSCVDFLTTFARSAYRWILTPDAGKFFNLGTVASPVAVPVVPSEEKISIDVETFVKGVEFLTAGIYAIPSAPTGSATNVTNPVVSTSATALKMRVYRSNSSGGSLSYRGESSSLSYTDSGGSGKFYKITVVGIGGESPYSEEFSPGSS